MSATWEPGLVSAQLLDLTHALGEPERDLVILAEGNTSERLEDGRVVVKASGASLRTATAADFVVVDVDPLVELMARPDATQADLTAALDAGEHDGRRRRASIETLVHVALAALHAQRPATPGGGVPPLFVGHTHPTAVVGLLASIHAATAWDRHVYSDEAVVLGHPLNLPYATPGLHLGRTFLEGLAGHLRVHDDLPSLVLLGNHGIVAAAPTPAGVEAVSAMAVKSARVRTAALSVGGAVPLDADAVDAFFAREDIAERRSALSGPPSTPGGRS